MKNISKYYIFAILLFLFFSVCSAQRNRSFLNAPINTDYREDLSDYFQVKFDINTDIVSYAINTTDDNLMVLAPNERALFRISLNYKNLGIKVDTNPGFLKNSLDEEVKGKTSYRRLGLRFNLGKLFNELEYSKVKGFYINNRIPYLKLPSYTTRGYSFKTNYIIGDKYSLRAIKIQTERQIRSAGTFIPTLKVNVTRHDMSEEDAENFGFENAISEKKIDLVSTIGYHHTLVIANRVFFGGALDTGFGYSRINAKIPVEESFNDNIFSLGLKLNLGYNSNRFFSGIEYNYIGENNISGKSLVKSRFDGDMQLYVGYRFDAPKPLKRSHKWVKDKLGI